MGLFKQLDLFLTRSSSARPALQAKSERKQTRLAKTGTDDFLHTLWRNLRREFFPDHTHIDEYIVSWSSRPQKRVLASCNIRRRRVVVARELFEPSASRWIAPVLYHEMCHAVIGEEVDRSRSGKRLWHGREFRQLEARHPDIPAMNLWISTGGWAMAVRSNRARLAWRARGRQTQLLRSRSSEIHQRIFIARDDEFAADLIAYGERFF